MSEVSDKLLRCLREEYQKTGKRTFCTTDMISYLEDPTHFNEAVEQLIKYKYIQDSKYVNCFDLNDV